MVFRKNSMPYLRSEDTSECTSSPGLHDLSLTLLRQKVMTSFILPLCTHLPHSTSLTPISSVTTIINLENVSLGTL